MDDKDETLAGTVGEHVNENHDHPTGKTPTGAVLDQTATKSPGQTGEDGALAGGPAPGHGRATKDGGTQQVADVDGAAPESGAMKEAVDDASAKGD